MELCLCQSSACSPLRVGHSRGNFRRSKFSFFVVSGAAPRLAEVDKSGRERGNRMFILGMGFVGQFFAHTLKEEGWAVTGTCTSMQKKKELEAMGFDAFVFDANKPELGALDKLKCYTHLLVSVPPVPGIGDQMLGHVELLRSSLADGDLQWLCYLSSTSVYGDWGGAWVDEDYPTRPASEGAKLRLCAEEGWLNLGHDLGLSTYVFRLGGIYGPGRSALDTIIKKEPMSKGQKMRSARKHTSRIHVEDICRALKACSGKPSSGKIYNIVDDDPAPREVVFAYAEDLIKKKWPRWIERRTRSESMPFPEKVSSRGEKRVSNARMKRELGVTLVHPTYRSGLQSIIDQMENPWD